MVWHIFRKDVKLFWRMAAGVAVLNALRPFAPEAAGHGGYAAISLLATVLATGLLIAAVVQADALAGLRQDWLVRPIRRTDLLLSKLAFIVLLIQLPIFLTDVAEGLAAGLPFVPVLGAALSRGLFMLIALDLPALAFATLTRNLTEGLAAGLVAALGVMLFLSVTQKPAQGVNFSGVAWIGFALQMECALCGAVAVACVQYYRRRTVSARWLSAATLAVAIATQFLPFEPAFAIQESLSPKSQETAGVQLTLESGWKWNTAGQANVDVGLPMRFTGAGLNERERVVRDHLAARLVQADGRTRELPQFRSYGLPFPIGQRVYESVLVPRDQMRYLRTHSARLEMDYSLTLERIAAEQTLTVDSDQLVNGPQRCVTGIDYAAQAVSVRCRAAGRVPCWHWSVEGPLFQGAYRSGVDGCIADYSPRFGDTFTDPIGSWTYSFPIAPAGAADERAELTKTRLVVQTWEAVAHFTRHATIPNFHLDEAQ
jgi:hypothetical protein